MAEAIGVVLGGAAVTSVVEYCAPKIIARVTDLKDKPSSWRRCREYRKYLFWTRSPLAISSALDWGHTCSIAPALNNSAKACFGKACAASRQPRCWAFTSRNLVEQALLRSIPAEDWVSLVELVFTDRFEKPLCTPLGECSDEFLRLFTGSVLQEFDELVQDVLENLCNISGSDARSRSVPYHLRNFLVGFIKKNSPGCFNYLESVMEVAEVAGDIKLYDRNNPKPDPDDSDDEHLGDDIEDGLRAVLLLQDMHTLCFQETTFQPVCASEHTSTRNRATQVQGCQGMEYRLPETRKSSTSLDSILNFFGREFLELNSAWHFWLSNWGSIVKVASETFPFKNVPSLHDLVLHDMSTGFCAPSIMRRRGAKLTDSRGTTIVHPGDRAAVVSSRLPSLSMEKSVVQKLGIRRRYRPTAQEFADYAILRCDLVSRKNMTFSDALADWNRLYTRWDRAPTTLSEWKMKDEAKVIVADGVLDSIRLVLLRQALGPNRSLQIVNASNIRSGLFGGFVLDHGPSEPQGANKTIILDEMLQILFLMYGSKYEEKWLVDTVGWNTSESASSKDDNGLFVKRVCGTGREDVFRVKKPLPEQIQKSARGRSGKQKCYCFE